MLTNANSFLKICCSNGAAWVLLGLLLFSQSLYAISAASYCIIDRSSKKVVKSKEYLKARAPASTVKLLTAMVILDHCSLDKKLVVSKRAASTAPVKIYLKRGEKVSCRDLLCALLLKSANDVAVVLEEGVTPSTSKFIQLLNEKARQIGCRNSRFLTPNGLPAKGQYSCAFDLALIAAASYQYKLIRQILSLKQATVKTSSGRQIVVHSHNRLLHRNIYGKTGWTIKAQHTFAGCMTIDGKKVAFAVMGTQGKRANLWTDIQQITRSLGINRSHRNIQKLLKKLGYYKGSVDGVFGPMTKKAVKNFQRDNGLLVDGVVGKNTWAKLKKHQ